MIFLTNWKGFQKMEINELRLNECVKRCLEEYFTSVETKLDSINLGGLLLKRNPYLLRVTTSSVKKTMLRLIEYSLFKSEETFFGKFFEDVAKFILSEAEFVVEDGPAGSTDIFASKELYDMTISVKSGPDWCNNDQLVQMVDHFRDHGVGELINGCGYGRDDKPEKTKTGVKYKKLCGQRFWTAVSGDTNMYTKIMHIIDKVMPSFGEAVGRIEDKKNSILEECLTEFKKADEMPWVEITKYNSEANKHYKSFEEYKKDKCQEKLTF